MWYAENQQILGLLQTEKGQERGSQDNADLLKVSFVINRLAHSIALVCKSATGFNKDNLFVAIGILSAFWFSLKTLLGLQAIDELKSEFVRLLK